MINRLYIILSADSERTTPITMSMSPADLQGMWYPSVCITFIDIDPFNVFIINQVHFSISWKMVVNFLHA